MTKFVYLISEEMQGDACGDCGRNSTLYTYLDDESKRVEVLLCSHCGEDEAYFEGCTLIQA